MRKASFILASVLAIALGIAACATQEGAREAATAAITEESWKQAMDAGDLVFLKASMRLPDAEKHYATAVQIAEGLGPDYNAWLVQSLSRLALVYKLQHKYAAAERLHQRVLAIREKAAPESPDVAHSLGELARLYEEQRKWAAAEPLYQRALAIYEKDLGVEHPKVAACLENYAGLLRKTNREVEAAEMEARAKAIRAKRR